MFDFRRYASLLVITLIIAISAISAVAAQSSEGPVLPAAIDENPLAQDAQVYAVDQGVTLEEAIRRLQLQKPIGELNAELTNKEQNTFAGLWIQHSPQYRVIIQFTNDGKETLQPYIEKGLLANIVEVKTANISLAELEAAQNAALRAVDELNIPVESGINVFENRVELYVTQRVQFDSALWTAKIQLPNHVEVIKVDELSTKETNIYAGLALSLCTSGFSVRNSSGAKGITTAAHCGQSLSYNGVALSFVSSAYGGSRDVQWHTTPGFTVRNLMYDGTYNRYVYSTKHRNSQALNEFVCKYGKTTQKTCGYIIDKNFRPSQPPSAMATYIRVHRDGVNLSSGGDSGGPWFSGNTAYGIHTDGLGNDAAYMAINYVDILGISVLTD